MVAFLHFYLQSDIIVKLSNNHFFYYEGNGDYANLLE